MGGGRDTMLGVRGHPKRLVPVLSSQGWIPRPPRPPRDHPSPTDTGMRERVLGCTAAARSLEGIKTRPLWEKRGGRARIIPNLPNAAFLGYSGESGVSAEGGRGVASRALGRSGHAALGVSSAGTRRCEVRRFLVSPIGGRLWQHWVGSTGHWDGSSGADASLHRKGSGVTAELALRRCWDWHPGHSLYPQPGCPTPSRVSILSCAASPSAVFIASFIGKFYFPCSPYREAEARGKAPGPQ